MMIALTGLTLIAAISAPAQAQDPMAGGRDAFLREFFAPPMCRSADGEVSADEIWVLRDEVVMLADGRTSVTVEGPTGFLFIKRPTTDGSPSTLSGPLNIHVPGNPDPDLNLKLAVFRGRLMVYWRESYLQRGYRFGLLEVNTEATLESADMATPFCDGVGGYRMYR